MYDKENTVVYDKDYALMVSKLPFDLRRRILRALQNTDYINTEYFVERPSKKAPWRLRWEQNGRTRAIALGTSEKLAMDVRKLVDKLYLEELCVILMLHTRCLHAEQKAKDRQAAQKRALQNRANMSPAELLKNDQRVLKKILRLMSKNLQSEHEQMKRNPDLYDPYGLYTKRTNDYDGSGRYRGDSWSIP